MKQKNEILIYILRVMMHGCTPLAAVHELATKVAEPERVVDGDLLATFGHRRRGVCRWGHHGVNEITLAELTRAKLALRSCHAPELPSAEQCGGRSGALANGSARRAG